MYVCKKDSMQKNLKVCKKGMQRYAKKVCKGMQKKGMHSKVCKKAMHSKVCKKRKRYAKNGIQKEICKKRYARYVTYAKVCTKIPITMHNCGRGFIIVAGLVLQFYRV
jgi:AAA+ superfamily predicted ATPase